jgi:hypothetical protein
MGPGETFSFIFFTIFGFAGFNAVLKHRLKMAEIRIRSTQANDASVQAAIDELRNEVRQLRDTTMRYDMSFDAALTRMEERVDRIETRTYTTTASNDPLARLRTEQ